ncbi:aminoacyl-tRNA hydrolase [Nitrosomonas sp. HPC101]|uniref:aminoacyl-tRNA hydrolase n=1 Tax=Nitrosomonas sp. HPC101 TaxID=1658667 RepID=UPI001370BB1C|nr:aminoacyl-tRNA hydrolase [Nitrosomonas sp. HPC101]MXS85794.1 aminoacyl-tRNA hydrolase [Nitrosomonas sp. HPC101]
MHYTQMKALYETYRYKAKVARTFFRAWVHRQRLGNVCFIGITGSAGKTTTKDFSHLLLSAFYPVSGTLKSLNVALAVAETVLRTDRQHRFCLLEISAGKPRALDLPMRLFKPQIGILTVIGRDHFRAFKGIEGIAAEKEKLITGLPHNGVAILNIDDPRVKTIGERAPCRVIWVGAAEGATIRLLSATSCWPEPLKLRIAFQGEEYEILTQLHGTHLALSVLAALGVAVAVDIPLKKAIPVLQQAVPAEGRMQIVTDDEGVVFIRDDMKAPYWSLQAPLNFLKQAASPRKVAVIGTLSDFSGDLSAKYKQFAREIRQYADLVVFVGSNAHRALRARKDQDDQSLQGFSNIHDAAIYLKNELRRGDLVLLKGSNTADHLIRLIHDRNQPIQCWRDRCGLEIFCDDCKYLYDATQHTPDQATVSVNDEISTSLPKSSQLAVPGAFVLVGLGNPGKEFEATPHNAGYQVLDRIAERFSGHWETIDEGLISLVNIDGNAVKLFKPAANMNVIGPVLRQFLANNGCTADHCTLIHDDMDLELGKVRLKHDGGDAGHRGVRSVITALGTDAVHRVRVGVRRPGDQRKAKDIVLTRFTPEEAFSLNHAIEQSVKLIDQHIHAGEIETMIH